MIDRGSPLLDVENVVIDFPRGRGKGTFRAIDDVSITIAPGETLGLVGESGSGKTTLGRAVLGLVAPTTGTVSFRGQDITTRSRQQRRSLAREVQVVFQDPYTSLNPMMSIGDILAEPLQVQGLSRSEARERIGELLDQVNLPTDSLSRSAREFSGGQRQRIAIARALAVNPALIVCDEPVSALDLTTQLRVLDLFKEIQDATGVAYLFISHDLAVIRAVSHRVAVMYHGSIVEQGTAEEVTTSPRDPYTRRLLMSAPIPDPIEQAKRRAERHALAGAGR